MEGADNREVVAESPPNGLMNGREALGTGGNEVATPPRRREPTQTSTQVVTVNQKPQMAAVQARAPAPAAPPGPQVPLIALALQQLLYGGCAARPPGPPAPTPRAVAVSPPRACRSGAVTQPVTDNNLTDHEPPRVSTSQASVLFFLRLNLRENESLISTMLRFHFLSCRPIAPQRSPGWTAKRTFSTIGRKEWTAS